MPSITLQAGKENFGALMEFVEENAKTIGFASSALNKVKLAAEEAMINVIQYAYPRTAGHITVICDELPAPRKGLRLQISDRGIPFDPLAQASPDTKQAIDKRPIGGLGIHMIKKIADQISYKRENEANLLTIVFYLSEKK